MRSLGFLVPQPAVGEHDGRGSVRLLLEFDLHELEALLRFLPISGPGEDQALGRRDLKVFAAPAELLAVWAGMTSRSLPPTRTSTSTTGVSQSGPAGHQRLSTSVLVQASKTARAGA